MRRLLIINKHFAFDQSEVVEFTIVTVVVVVYFVHDEWSQWMPLLQGLVHTDTFFRSMRFRCHRSASIVRVRATVLICFRLSTRQTFENDRIARCDASWTLCKYYNKRYFRSSFLFWCVFDRFRPSTNTICMRFRFDPLSRAFLNRCVLNENVECINLDGRLNACMRFQTRRR